MTLPKAFDQSAALLALRQALEGRAELGHHGLQFAMAHQCARNLLGAMRFVRQASAPDAPDATEPELAAAAVRIRADFAAASPLAAEALQQAYWRRGWWLRWLKFRKGYAYRSA
jgi:hypothetical protein